MKRERNAGFTLVELIIVIAVIAVLSAVAAPQYIRYVEKSRKTVCNANRETVCRSMYLSIAAGEADSDAAAYALLCTGSGELAGKMDRVCPSGGTVSWDAVNGTLSCSKHGPVVYFSDLTKWAQSSLELAVQINRLLDGSVKSGFFDSNGMLTLNNLTSDAAKYKFDGVNTLTAVAQSTGVSEESLRKFAADYGGMKLVAGAEKNAVVSVVYKSGNDWNFVYSLDRQVVISEKDYNQYVRLHGLPAGSSTITGNAGQAELGRDAALAEQAAKAIADDKAANPGSYK